MCVISSHSSRSLCWQFWDHYLFHMEAVGAGEWSTSLVTGGRPTLRVLWLPSTCLLGHLVFVNWPQVWTLAPVQKWTDLEEKDGSLCVSCHNCKYVATFTQAVVLLCAVFISILSLALISHYIRIKMLKIISCRWLWADSELSQTSPECFRWLRPPS